MPFDFGTGLGDAVNMTRKGLERKKEASALEALPLAEGVDIAKSVGSMNDGYNTAKKDCYAKTARRLLSVGRSTSPMRAAPRLNGPGAQGPRRAIENEVQNMSLVVQRTNDVVSTQVRFPYCSWLIAYSNRDARTQANAPPRSL